MAVVSDDPGPEPDGEVSEIGAETSTEVPKPRFSQVLLAETQPSSTRVRREVSELANCQEWRLAGGSDRSGSGWFESSSSARAPFRSLRLALTE